MSLAQVVAGPADDDLLLEGQILINDMPQRQDLGLRLVLDQSQHIDGKGGLELGLSKEAVEHHLGIGVPLELNDDPHAVPVGLVYTGTSYLSSDQAIREAELYYTQLDH